MFLNTSWLMERSNIKVLGHEIVKWSMSVLCFPVWLLTSLTKHGKSMSVTLLGVLKNVVFLCILHLCYTLLSDSFVNGLFEAFRPVGCWKGMQNAAHFCIFWISLMSFFWDCSISWREHLHVAHLPCMTSVLSSQNNRVSIHI